MNDTSRAAVRLVESINETANKTIAAYTFDAGPNAVVYYLAEHEVEILGTFKGILGSKQGWEGKRGQEVTPTTASSTTPSVAAERLSQGISRVILTGVGEGPIKTTESLIDENGETIVV